MYARTYVRTIGTYECIEMMAITGILLLARDEECFPNHLYASHS